MNLTITSTTVLHRAIASSTNLTTARRILRGLPIPNVRVSLFGGGSAPGQVLTTSQAKADSQPDSHFSYSLKNFDRWQQILSLLERMRPTRELTATHASATPTLKIQRSAIAHSGFSSSYSGRRDAPPRFAQFLRIHTQELLTSYYRLGLIPSSNDRLISPVEATPASTGDAATAFAEPRALRASFPGPLVTPLTAYPQSLPRAVSNDRESPGTYATIAAADAFHRLRNRLDSMAQSLSLPRRTLLLGATVASANRFMLSLTGAARGLETMLNEVLRFFLRWDEPHRSNQPDLLKHQIATRPAPMPHGLRHAATTAALTTALMMGNATRAFAHAPTFVTHAPPTISPPSTAHEAKAPVTINYSPAVTINAQETTDDEAIGRRVMEVLERHGRDLHRILERDLVRRQRTEF